MLVRTLKFLDMHDWSNVYAKPKMEEYLILSVKLIWFMFSITLLHPSLDVYKLFCGKSNHYLAHGIFPLI